MVQGPVIESGPDGMKAIADKAKALAKGIGWLSGSLAGICAILTVLGYLATMSHLHMLGMDVIAGDFNAEFQLRRGGKLHFFCPCPGEREDSPAPFHTFPSCRGGLFMHGICGFQGSFCPSRGFRQVPLWGCERKISINAPYFLCSRRFRPSLRGGRAYPRPPRTPFDRGDALSEAG